MKIQGDDLRDLQAMIRQTVDELGQEQIEQHIDTIIHDARVKDHTKRLCFDILYASDRADRNEIIPRIYKYANDDHIFTALKAALRPQIGTLRQKLGARHSAHA